MPTDYVIDTHALIWNLEGNPRLGTNAKAVLADPHSVLILPIIALAEACWIVESGKTSIARVVDLLRAVDADARVTVTSLDRSILDLAHGLTSIGEIHDCLIVATALQLAPTYADAHYNLALAFEKIREPRKALKHWQAYIKLDTTGPWSVHARNQIQRILQGDGLKLVHSRRG